MNVFQYLYYLAKYYWAGRVATNSHPSFKARYSSLKATPKGDAVIYGDSITEGNTTLDIAGFDTNLGSSGDVVVGVIYRLFNDQFRLKHPTKISFLIGVNTLSSTKVKTFLKQYEVLIRFAIIRFPNTCITVNAIMPTGKKYANLNYPITLANRGLKSLCLKYDVPYNPLTWSALNDNGMLYRSCSDDYIHPNNTGYLVLNSVLR